MQIAHCNYFSIVSLIIEELMGIVFEWDNAKAKTNILKHRVSFEESTTIFGDDRAITIVSPIHSNEKRFVTIGLSAKMRILVVVHTDRGETIRIISARQASRKER